MNFAIRYLTEYRYEAPVTDNLNALRVRPATTSTQRCDEFHARIDPETRVSRHVDYFGTEVLEFGIPTPHDHLHDRRALARRDLRSARAAGRPVGGARGAGLRGGRRASSCCRGRTRSLNGGLDELEGALNASSPLATLPGCSARSSPTTSSTAAA